MSSLNKYLKSENFKMETPESIRTSLQKDEWVTSIDFKDVYFQIPLNPQSRKYLCFHIQGQSYQFKALPFGLSAPMEFTMVVKEVKLLAQNKSHIPPNLSPSYPEKSQLEPKEIFEFVGYQYNLRESKVRRTLEHWQTLNLKMQKLLSDPLCQVRQLMSLIALLTATEKQVHLAQHHMRPIQWHLKTHWRIHTYKRWLQDSNVLQVQPLHTLSHALQIFTDA